MEAILRLVMELWDELYSLWWWSDKAQNFSTIELDQEVLKRRRKMRKFYWIVTGILLVLVGACWLWSKR